MNKRQVFFNCDGNGVLPVSVAVYSLLKNADHSQPIDIYIAHDGGFVKEGGCDKVSSVVSRFPFARVEFIDFKPFYLQYRALLQANNSKWPPLVWAWCFAADLLPHATGNLVFIDWDMYVRHDLAELYALDLDSRGYVSAAVDESRREDRPYLVTAGWSEKAGYSVNTGLQVINLDAFRREHIREKILDWYSKHYDIAECVEQDALNAVAGEKILRLHLKYNFTVGWLDRIIKYSPLRKEWRVYPRRMVFEACADPMILHFIGHMKPWRWNHRPYRNCYRQAMIELGFTDGALPGETTLRRLIGVCFDAYHALLTIYARIICLSVR